MPYLPFGGWSIAISSVLKSNFIKKKLVLDSLLKQSGNTPVRRERKRSGTMNWTQSPGTKETPATEPGR